MDPDPVLLPGKFHVSLIFITASIKKQTKKITEPYLSCKVILRIKIMYARVFGTVPDTICKQIYFFMFPFVKLQMGVRLYNLIFLK